MNWFKKLLGGGDSEEAVDYYEEGLALQRAGKFHDALTSFRLALRESPGDTVVLQQIAITYTRIGMTDEAIRTYRTVLDREPDASGAHYGLAFILLKRGEEREAVRHLKAFLGNPPRGGEAEEHIGHARATLAQLRGETDEMFD
ncbi:MAG: tetratricopeptide repeat protein [Gemmatimonadales bacterium]|nr:MAG: tetratricopeptide repeat protein [Gemmatimonadales bacterium]